MSEKIKRKMITIYPIDEATVHQIGKDEGIMTFSGTLRWILRDWKRMKAQQTLDLAASRATFTTEQPQ